MRADEILKKLSTILDKIDKVLTVLLKLSKIWLSILLLTYSLVKIFFGPI